MQQEPEKNAELPLREAVLIAVSLIAGLAVLFAILTWMS
jgi:hypothetical protein